MPVSALTPYVPDPIYSEDPSEELGKILDGMEKHLRDELTESEQRLFSESPHLKLVKLTDWSGILDLTDVTLSRYSQGHRDPPKAVVHFLRIMHNRVQENPRKGVNALIDFIGRSKDLSLPDSSGGTVGPKMGHIEVGEARVHLGENGGPANGEP